MPTTTKTPSPSQQSLLSSSSSLAGPAARPDCQERAPEAEWALPQVFHSPDCSAQAAAHLTRDTLNPTALDHQRFNGSWQSTTHATHCAPADQPKSPYGRTRLVQDTFYRPRNVFFSPLEAQ